MFQRPKISERADNDWKMYVWMLYTKLLSWNWSTANGVVNRNKTEQNRHKLKTQRVAFLSFSFLLDVASFSPLLWPLNDIFFFNFFWSLKISKTGQKRV